MCALVHLQVSDVFVDVHWGSHAAIRDIFVVVGIRFAVHRVHARNGNFLVASRDIPEYNRGVIYGHVS